MDSSLLNLKSGHIDLVAKAKFKAVERVSRDMPMSIQLNYNTCRSKSSALVVALLAGFMFSSLSAASVVQRSANNGNLQMADVPLIPQSVVDDLNRYQNVRSAPFQDWASPGGGLYVTTRFGDVSQLHKVAKAGAARQQLTFFDEPVLTVSRQPHGNLICFTMDSGGSENAQVFIFDPATGESKMISDGRSRNGIPLWRRDGKAVVYSSTRRNGASNDLWLTEIRPPFRSRMILKASDGSWWGPHDWSQDGRRLLVEQYISVVDSRVHLLNVKTGKLQQIKGSAESPSVNYVVAFDKSERGFYFLTDADTDFAKLAYQAFRHKEHVLVTHNIPWDIDKVVLSQDRERLAFTVNAGGLSELYLMNGLSDNFSKPEDNQRLTFGTDEFGQRVVYRINAANAEYAKVANLPIGTIGNMNFDPSGQQLALTLSTAQNPSDTFVLSLRDNKLEHGALTRWTSSEVGGLNTNDFAIPELIQYPSFDLVKDAPRQIPAFVYKPANRGSKSNRKPLPVIITIHGGPESQYRPSFNSNIQLWVNKLGAAVIAPNVRGSGGYGGAYVSLDNGYKREDSVKDIGALLNWIATQPDLDQNRVAVIGGSYGGYMSLASAVHYSDRLRAAVDVVGISNFVTFLKNTKDYRRALRRPEYGDERDPKMFEFLQKISPNNNVEKIKIPLLVVQGQNDPRVPVTESQQIVEALRAQGNDVWYMNALNEGHGYRRKDNRDIYQQAVVMFFKKHLEIQ